jgi:hypothetical protein
MEIPISKEIAMDILRMYYLAMRSNKEVMRYLRWRGNDLAGGCTIDEMENWFLWEALN